MATTLIDAVRIVEVGPRDGLQNVKQSIPTATKVELIKRLRETGLKTIELTSIVSPKAVPQLSDARHLLADRHVQAAIADDAFRHPVLVPNMKSLQIALHHGVREVAVFVSASEGFSRANLNSTVSGSLARSRQVARTAVEAGLYVRGYVSCIFECPFDGATRPEAVVEIVKDLLDMGCYEVSLGDTLGVGTAIDVHRLLQALRMAGIPLVKLAGHFHDSYGQAVSNVWAAYKCGVRTFDSSIAGLGGCPHCPGAKGNASTEDLVYMFDRAGIDTGVDLSELVQVGDWISNTLSLRNNSRVGAALSAKPAAARGVVTSRSREGCGQEVAAALLTSQTDSSFNEASRSCAV